MGLFLCSSPLWYYINMTPESETYTFEGRTYARPEVPITETDEFIANLRAVQEGNNTDIKTQTENLGTDVPSVQGGLIGPESYFTSRYQTPQTNQIVAELRSAAQASALNTALSNLQSQYQKSYQDAYRNYQKRASSGSGSGSGSGTSGNQDTTVPGSVTEESTGDGGIKVSQDSITGTTAPREGLSDTSYLKDGHWYTVYSDGSTYIDGILESEWNKMTNEDLAARASGRAVGSSDGKSGGGW